MSRVAFVMIPHSTYSPSAMCVCCAFAACGSYSLNSFLTAAFPVPLPLRSAMDHNSAPATATTTGLNAVRDDLSLDHNRLQYNLPKTTTASATHYYRRPTETITLSAITPTTITTATTATTATAATTPTTASTFPTVM